MRHPRTTARAAEGEEVTAGAAADHTAATLRGGGAKVLRALVREHRHECGMHGGSCLGVESGLIEITAETPPLHRA
jgi:hypothetical protein